MREWEKIRSNKRRKRGRRREDAGQWRGILSGRTCRKNGSSTFESHKNGNRLHCISVADYFYFRSICRFLVLIVEIPCKCHFYGASSRSLVPATLTQPSYLFNYEAIYSGKRIHIRLKHNFINVWSKTDIKHKNIYFCIHRNWMFTLPALISLALPICKHPIQKIKHNRISGNALAAKVAARPTASMRLYINSLILTSMK